MPLKKDYIYLAGFIDGEGCIRVNNAPRLHITNTNKDIMDWIKDNFGGYLWAEEKSYIENAKTRYIWEISSRKLLVLLLEILPYLRVKKPQAKLVTEYYNSAVKIAALICTPHKRKGLSYKAGLFLKFTKSSSLH